MTVRWQSRKAQITIVLLLSSVMLVWAGMEVVGPISTGPSTPVSEVTRGRFVNRVDAEGVLAAETATAITGPETRRDIFIGWIAEDGSRVEAGDLLVRFDSTELETELLETEDELEQTLRRRDQRVQQEETALANLLRDANMAERQLDYAETFQSKDPEIFSRMEIIQSEIDSTLATRRRDNANRTHEIREDLGAVELDLLDLQRERAQLDIDDVEEDLQQLEIRAPHDGIFVLTSDDRGDELPVVGMEVHGRQTIAEIPQLGVMKANVYVLEADAGGLRAGTPAEVVVEAHPNEVFAGTIRRISALARRKSRFSPVQYFEVEIDLERTEPELMKPGQRVRATLLLEDLADVLTIPREAVFDGEDGAKIAYVDTVGGFEPVEIVVGPTALGRVVVESGLEEGDQVALQDPTRDVAVDLGTEPSGDTGGIPTPGGGQ